MPSLNNVAEVLRQYAGRYEYLDAFADDVDELREGTLAAMPAIQAGPAEVAVQPNGGSLLVHLFPQQGIARFRLAEAKPERGSTDSAVAGAVLGGLIGATVTAASKTKEGLLGGLVMGMLVGGLVGAGAAPVERVLALKFDPVTRGWQLYDGPLLRWAKRTLHPMVPPAA